MKRAIFVNIGVGLVLSLLLFSFQLSSIKATDTERANISTTTDAPSSVALSTWKTLTNSEIKANWPNLPTAKEIWDTYWGKPPGVWYVNTAEA